MRPRPFAPNSSAPRRGRLSASSGRRTPSAPVRLRAFPSVAAACAAAWLAACAPSLPPAPADPSSASGSPAPIAEDSGTVPEPIGAPGGEGGIRFQIIYVIHGDGGYVWYDDSGTRREADREALAQARATARAAAAAEVFIFHQRPTRFLRFFHGSDGTLWQYRRGRLIRKVPYDRRLAHRLGAGASARPSRVRLDRERGPDGGEDGGLDAEAALFARFASRPAPRRCALPAAQGASAPRPARIFCYFGHGIPITGKAAYFRSRPDVAVSISGFARALVRFGGPACPPAKPFSLVVLSACHGGTPEATLALAPYADWILASPGELHLSYLETRALGRLARDASRPADAGTMGRWARALAEESFARLGRSVRTGVSIALYETSRSEPYLRDRIGAWAVGERAFPGAPLLLEEPSAYRDCGENPAFGPGGEEAGVLLFYRPPRFGIDKGKAAHSGWECPETDPRSASSG